ncbi:sugar ABC transporter ATP-binding protein [Humibacter sp.]|uniref:sugar ABC transporter ATP-binding protein n=1 Tax=Humibacter sp. TaxID=1940291 RepID=UPI003F7D999C
MSSADPFIRMQGITVRYPGHLALDDVDLDLHRGEVHSLLGENGAGKSTLIRVLTGAIRPVQGEILCNGAPLQIASPRDALAAGIGVVHQEAGLLPNLPVSENIMLGDEPHGRFGIDRGAMAHRAAELLDRLGADVDPRSALGEHPPAVRQLVAIARAVRSDPRVLVLDEPTASLGEAETERVLDVIRSLRDDGVAVLFVSHLLEQVYEIADRLTVLRGGVRVGEFPTSDILRRDLVQRMLGRDPRELDEIIEERSQPIACPAPILRAEGVRSDALRAPADLELSEGEIVGVAGLLGSGRTELARAITGVDPIVDGRLVGGTPQAEYRSPRAALDSRVVYASESRVSEGLVGQLSVRENITLAVQAQRGWFLRMPRARQHELAMSYLEALNVWPCNPEQPAASLSSGNQQKILLARWLAIAPRVLVLDEPTRGIDVGAKVEVQRLVASMAANGVGVVYISTEPDEVLRLSDRIVIMRDRTVLGTVVNDDELDRELLLTLIADGGEANGTD